MTTDPHLTPVEREARRAEREAREKRKDRNAIIRWSVVAAMVLVVGVVVLLQSAHQLAVTSCQAAYNNAFAVNLTARAALTDQDHNATTRLIEGVFAPPKGQTEAERRAYFSELFTAYYNAEQRITAARKTHPFPQLPSKACR